MNLKRTILFALFITTTAAADPPKLSGEIAGLRNAKGTVLCTLFASDAGFPKDPTKALRRTESSIRGNTATCTFENVPPGTYAISFIHDENDNKKLDTNFLGMPSEGYGTSRDARGGVGGPPKWNDAKFEYKGGALALAMKPAY